VHCGVLVHCVFFAKQFVLNGIIGCQAEDSKKVAESHEPSEAQGVLKQLSRFDNGLQVLQTLWS
jgi:hypothetical protein